MRMRDTTAAAVSIMAIVQEESECFIWLAERKCIVTVSANFPSVHVEDILWLSTCQSEDNIKMVFDK
jgi:hypothetical protein